METNELNELKMQEKKIWRMLNLNVKQEDELLELRIKLATTYFRLMDLNIKSTNIFYYHNKKGYLLNDDNISNINEIREHISVLDIIGEKIFGSIDKSINVNYNKLYNLHKEIEAQINELERYN